MTGNLERQLSTAALEAQTPEGARELAAAEIMVKASTLMWKAFEQSGLTQRQLADALDVSEGRVSQILHGDGNVRLSTLARYLRATGYLARLEAEPADPSVPPLRRRQPRRASRRQVTDEHDLYAVPIEHGGGTYLKLTAMPAGVPYGAPELASANHVGTTNTRMEWSPIGVREVANR
ncbi:helix-turn-helix protein [Microbacterium azadirachtae]|uniref:Helix-turn-helix protein n=1 Tax=Microbacterium azadirachtae TaxID=582680 RepID=A0A0F0KD97_9MICO|nr:helix-turn-helix transcriptional regulator [Microbacterium azadirachtae]KJL18828.1 helix-turn-helix protein [Microbacterium azadirachtae]